MSNVWPYLHSHLHDLPHTGLHILCAPASASGSGRGPHLRTKPRHVSSSLRSMVGMAENHVHSARRATLGSGVHFCRCTSTWVYSGVQDVQDLCLLPHSAVIREICLRRLEDGSFQRASLQFGEQYVVTSPPLRQPQEWQSSSKTSSRTPSV